MLMKFKLESFLAFLLKTQSNTFFYSIYRSKFSMLFDLIESNFIYGSFPQSEIQCCDRNFYLR